MRNRKDTPPPFPVGRCPAPGGWDAPLPPRPTSGWYKEGGCMYRLATAWSLVSHVARKKTSATPPPRRGLAGRKTCGHTPPPFRRFVGNRAATAQTPGANSYQRGRNWRDTKSHRGCRQGTANGTPPSWPPPNLTTCQVCPAHAPDHHAAPRQPCALQNEGGPCHTAHPDRIAHRDAQRLLEGALPPLLPPPGAPRCCVVSSQPR